MLLPTLIVLIAAVTGYMILKLQNSDLPPNERATTKQGKSALSTTFIILGTLLLVFLAIGGLAGGSRGLRF